MALADPFTLPGPKGAERPRVAPPVPANSDWREFSDFAASIGINLLPWQKYVARFLTATADDHWLYREVAVIVARQNGKTMLLVPLIVQRLLRGQRIMHTAQNAKLPREVHEMVAAILQEHYPDRLPKRRSVSFAVGHEEIKVTGGGVYRIVAPTRGGARGPSNDLVIIDELREMVSYEFIGAAKPTLTASRTPQFLYLSNAGTDASAVLNGLRDRSADDPALAYLEWSAAPERPPHDVTGWAESNPAMGYEPPTMGSVYETLQTEYRTALLQGTMGIFETEHLCRWVHTVLPPIIRPETWEELRGDVEPPRRPALGVSLDPTGTRASAVLAWQQADGRIAVRLIADVTGDPVDVPAFGADLKELARDYRVSRVGYDGATDLELAKYFKKPEAISGAKFTNASSMFVNLAEGHALVWDGTPITPDIEWTGRKTHESPGTWTATKLSDEHPVTAMLATIRAVFLSSGPRPVRPRVH